MLSYNALISKIKYKRLEIKILFAQPFKAVSFSANGLEAMILSRSFQILHRIFQVSVI